MPDDTQNALNIVLSGIKGEMQRLADAGGKNFIIANLPDLGVTPVAYEYEANEKLSSLAIEHNVMLQDYVTDFQSSYPDSSWIYLNVGEMFNDLITEPVRFGFSPDNLKSTCYDKYSDKDDKETMMSSVSSIMAGDDDKDPCEGYLFFDMVHPTALAHKILADRTLDLLDNAGITFAKKSSDDIAN
jgi:phospholipase/lecithinase/hemolysin